MKYKFCVGGGNWNKSIYEFGRIGYQIDDYVENIYVQSDIVKYFLKNFDIIINK